MRGLSTRRAQRVNININQNTENDFNIDNNDGNGDNLIIPVNQQNNIDNAQINIP